MSGVKDLVRALAVGFRQLLKKPETIMWPYERHDYGPGFRGFLINDRSKCIGCAMCETACPAKAIKMYKGEDGKLYPGIDYGRCILCGYCVDACPTGSLQHTYEHELVLTRLPEANKSPWEMEPGSAPRQYEPGRQLV